MFIVCSIANVCVVIAFMMSIIPNVASLSPYSDVFSAIIVEKLTALLFFSNMNEENEKIIAKC